MRKANEGTKFDNGKPQWLLLYFPFFEEVVRVLELGKEKYGFKNYTKGLSYWRIFNAMIRHMVAMTYGEWYDKESGMSHLAHIAANAMMIFENNDIEQGTHKQAIPLYDEVLDD